MLDKCLYVAGTQETLSCMSGYYKSVFDDKRATKTRPWFIALVKKSLGMKLGHGSIPSETNTFYNTMHALFTRQSNCVNRAKSI